MADQHCNPSIDANYPLPDDVRRFIESDGFPCIGAKSALGLEQIAYFASGSFCAPLDYQSVHETLGQFGAGLAPLDMPFKSFIWGFAPGSILSELAFEQRLWAHLQALHDFDTAKKIDWARGVSCDPAELEFSMSTAGQAYFIVGLHPGASRAARRFCRPLLVFNAHEQFEQLRADRRYDMMQGIIRQREFDLNGSINPMLGTHGKRAQAPQFSGRAVGDDWKCPLRVNTKK